LDTGQRFTKEDAARIIRSRQYRRSTTRIDTEPTGTVRGTEYVRRTLSWLMVPLLAVAILGSDTAVSYFPMLPLSIREAQFTYQQAVHGIRLQLDADTEILESDIMTDPRTNSTLYFSERLQTAVLDGLLNRLPSLYIAINEWIENRFQQELALWQQSSGTPSASNPSYPQIDPTLRPNPFASVRFEPARNELADTPHIASSISAPVNAVPVSDPVRTYPNDPYAYTPSHNDPYAQHGPSPSIQSVLPTPPQIGNNFSRNMGRWANKVLRATDPDAAASGFAAERLPPKPRKRPQQAASGASQPPLPRQAAKARIRHQRESS